MAMNQKQTLLVVTGVTVLLCGGAGGGVYWAQGLIEEENVQIQDKRNQIDAASKKIKKIPGIEKRVIVLRETVKAHVKILPKEAALNKFMRQAQNFALKSNIKIDRFLPVRGARGGAFQRKTYQFYFEATLWDFMKFMNFFENHERFVSVEDFTLNAGKASKVGEEAVHKIRLTVSAFLYNPPTAAQKTRIDNYPIKVKLYQSEILAHAQKKPDTFAFSGREGRRDIFVDPRQKTDIETQGFSLDQQRSIVERVSASVSQLRDWWKDSLGKELSLFEKIELRNEVITGLGKVKAEVEDVLVNKRISNPSLNSRWYKDVQMPLKELDAKVAAVRGLDKKKYLSKAEFAKLIDRLTEQLAEGELEKAVATHASFGGKLDVPKEHPQYPARVKIEALIHKATLAIEFSAIPLVISGVLVNGGGGKSGAILNGEVFEEGEYVSENLFVKAVHQEDVVFVYKGFTLLKTF